MKCSAVITIQEDKSILKSFAPEDKQIGERAAYSIKKKGSDIIFTIQAEDAAAMRAAFNSVTKMLVVSEKMKDVE